MGTDLRGHGLRGALLVGTPLGAYEIEAVLGHGGFGIVYKARHLELGTIVAIKEFFPIEIAVREQNTVHPRSLDSVDAFEEAINRFLEEAKQLCRFRHDSGVITCLDFFRTNGTAYLVMEHEDGMPLSKLLERREAAGNPFGEGELLSVAESLLESLSRVHKEGILHRDIKPSNILIRREDDRPILIDFGAVKQTVTLQTKLPRQFSVGLTSVQDFGSVSRGDARDSSGGLLASVSQARIRRRR
ncbi:MAG: serine/threonine-protein kinase [Bryobacterales bacterium]|nr:serine/threonine-protein kinase [Bryobacterales bacterium]